MPIPNYGLWKGHVVSWAPYRALVLQLGAGEDDTLSASVNVVSQSSESSLVYWLDKHLIQPQLFSQLSKLKNGFHTGPRDKIPALDLLRGNLVKFEDAIFVPHSQGQLSHDIADRLCRIFLNAINNEAKIYIFGSFSKGYACNIHMNQGNSNYFQHENSTFQDGGIILQFDDGHWEAIFIAFTSQASITGENGQAAGPLLNNYQLVPSRGNINDADDDHESNSQLSESDKDTDDFTGIRRRTENCQDLFDKCQQTPALSEGDWFHQMSAKFNWWSLGIGAGKSGHFSLDHRVRNRKDIRDELISLLDSLIMSLMNCIDIGKLDSPISTHWSPNSITEGKHTRQSRKSPLFSQ